MTATTPRTRAQACEASENVGRNCSDNPTLGDVIAIRFGRRDFLKGALGVTAIAATVSPLAFAAGGTARADNGPRFNFKEVTAGVDLPANQKIFLEMKDDVRDLFDRQPVVLGLLRANKVTPMNDDKRPISLFILGPFTIGQDYDGAADRARLMGSSAAMRIPVLTSRSNGPFKRRDCLRAICLKFSRRNSIRSAAKSILRNFRDAPERHGCSPTRIRAALLMQPGRQPYFQTSILSL